MFENQKSIPNAAANRTDQIASNTVQNAHGARSRGVVPFKQTQGHDVIRTTYTTACSGKIQLTEKALKHLEAHPEVIAMLPQAISRASLIDVDHLEIEIDMGEVVGRRTLVTTTKSDTNATLQFATRTGRTFPSRVVPAESLGDETRSITVIAQKSGHKCYRLITAWIGSKSQKEPWDKNIKSASEFKNCLEFWSSHALIHDPTVMGEIFESTWTDVLKTTQP